MPVNSQHKEYRAQCKRWDLVRSIVDNRAEHLIRVVDPTDIQRSEEYRKNAVLTNFTGLTKTGLTGLVFRKEPIYSVPSEIEYIIEDATGEGISLEQFNQRVVGDLLETGRFGFLVDYPKAPENMSLEEEQSYAYAAHIKGYSAESIINWNTKTIGGKVVVSLVVLKECVDELVDDFDWVEKIQYRVLQLDDSNMYVQSVWNEELELESVTIPLKKDGSRFAYIPFAFVGSENNDSAVDTIPLYDIAAINAQHYRNSADLEESGHVCGQPFLTISTDVDYESFKAANPNGIKFGARQGCFLGSNGQAQLLQANPNQLISQMMTEKKEYIVALGARIISPPGGRETAEAARIRMGSQNSALFTLAKNVSEANERALEFICDFMGGNKDSIEYMLNDQFYDETVDPAVLAQQIMLLDRNAMTVEEVRNNLRLNNILDNDSTDEGLDEMTHSANPLEGADVSEE